MEDQAALFNGLPPGSIFRFAGIDQLGIAGQGDLLVRVVHHQIAAGGDLVVNYTDEKITLTGDAKLVYTGEAEY